MGIVFDAGATFLLVFGVGVGFTFGYFFGEQRGKRDGFIAGRRSRSLTHEG